MHEDKFSSRNIGAAKSRYRAVFRKLLKEVPVAPYYGPSYSSEWHMNRMVIYLETTFEHLNRLPLELFIRTDLDYFIGFGNYWRYKGINLFASSKSLDKTGYKRNFNRKIRRCQNFSEVQRLMFEEVSKGQLELF
jgi:hypothetical protein